MSQGSNSGVKRESVGYSVEVDSMDIQLHVTSPAVDALCCMSIHEASQRWVARLAAGGADNLHAGLRKNPPCASSRGPREDAFGIVACKCNDNST